MSKTWIARHTAHVFIVEEWGTVGGDHDECKASYCFDTEHEAKAFADIMQRLYGNITSDWYVETKPIFTHMQDVLTMLGVETDK